MGRTRQKLWQVTLRNSGVTYTTQYQQGCKYEANVHQIEAVTFKVANSNVEFFDSAGKTVAFFVNVESVIPKKA